MNSDGSSNKAKQIAATVAVLLVVVLVVFGAKAFDGDDMHRTSNLTANNPTTSATPDTSTATSTTTTSTNNSTTTTGSYKNGTYSASGTYDSPGGFQSVGVRLTIQNSKVTAATVVDQATDRDSEEYQLAFIDGYKSFVVGKSVDSIHLSQVSGSSLTSQGFNNALEQIKNQAKA